MPTGDNLNKTPYIVGISGGSASGKTRFLHQLQSAFQPHRLTVISLDDYYKPIEKQKRDDHDEVNFDLPEAIDLPAFLQDIRKLQNNQEVQRPEYVYNNPNARPGIKTASPAPIIVMEGVFLFYFEELKKLMDLKLFIDARPDIKFSRRLARDETERGIPAETILHQWHRHVYPAYQRYVLPFREEADLVIHNNVNFEKGLEVIVHHLKAIINE